MTQLTDREKLVRMARGENVSDSLRYWIEYSLDIRGNITIWGGMSYYLFEAQPYDDTTHKVHRQLCSIYDYPTLFPATLRIYQMEQELDERIPDDRLVEEFLTFRRDHPRDGYGFRLLLERIKYQQRKDSEEGGLIDTEGILDLRKDRDDKREVLDRLMRQERQDILNLWGIDCPPDINSGEKYGKRLFADRGSVSGWFLDEFERLGGDRSRKLRPSVSLYI